MPRTAATSSRARRPVLIWVLRPLRVLQLAMLLAFGAYAVSFQVDAVAYLAGQHRPVITGAVPPVPLTGIATAVVDVIVGLFMDALAAFALLLVIAVTQARIRYWIRGRHARSA